MIILIGIIITKQNDSFFSENYKIYKCKLNTKNSIFTSNYLSSHNHLT